MSKEKLVLAQVPVVGNPSRRKRKSLPKAATDCLKRWMLSNKHHPYPDESLKASLAVQFQLTVTQINNWFINNRRRYFKKLFPEHDRNPVFTPKRGAGRSIKRRKPASLCEDNLSSSSEEIMPPRKLCRTSTALSEKGESSSIYSSDSDSSLDIFVIHKVSPSCWYEELRHTSSFGENFLMLVNTAVCRNSLVVS